MSAQYDHQRVFLYDTTLRDGAQTSGVDFSVEDKTTIARWLDDLGIDYIEGGWPGANQTDIDFFAAPPALKAHFVAFGMTRREGQNAKNDPGLNTVLDAAQHVCLFGKSWDFHVTEMLKATFEENLDFISTSVAEGISRDKDVLFDAEHFFDGYKANPDFALECLKAAAVAGASWLVLCDTNGRTLPHEIYKIVSEVKAALPEARLGIHTHNDRDCAVANSIEAVRAGCRLVQGTLNGLGERCGNANLVSLIPSLREQGYALGVSDTQMTQLTGLSHALDELLDRQSDPGRPFVGKNAFSHKGGVHASAVNKKPEAYEHLAPERVGNKRKVIMSNQAGRANVVALLHSAAFSFDEKDPRLSDIVDRVKQKERKGYSFDNAPGSFALLAKDVLEPSASAFEIVAFHTSNTVALEGRGLNVSNASITLHIGNATVTESGTGNGPVNALDVALRKALEPHFPDLRDVRLSDYHVRILNTRDATAATTRVCVEMSSQKTNKVWRTTGVSANVVSASIEALCDGYKYLFAFVTQRQVT